MATDNMKLPTFHRYKIKQKKKNRPQIEKIKCLDKILSTLKKIKMN